jgi:hypothetical protein
MKIFRLFSPFAVCLLLLSCTYEESVVADPLYDDVPFINDCRSGSLSRTEKQKVLNYINSVRALHNLPDVTYDSLNDKVVQNAALIGAANGDISDAIVESDFCYSESAALEYRRVNRSLWKNADPKWPSSEIHVNDWMTELNSGNINNRRRILDPFLKSITFGRVIGTPKKGDFKYVSSAVLKTSDGADLADSEISYIAYPQGNYNAKFFDSTSILSFSVLHDKSVKAYNGESRVDFSSATVEVSIGSQGVNIVEGSRVSDNDNYGLPNNLQWKIVGLKKNVTYTIKIQGVKVAATNKDYEYTFSFR